jgi:hypothetical protein
MDEFLKPAELAARWRTTVETLKTDRYRGRGPAYVKRGATVLYRLSDVEKYEEARTQGART